LKLEEVDKADDNCKEVEWGCKIKKVTIPKLVSLPMNRALLFIGKIDKQSAFVRDHANTHEFAHETRFGNAFNRYYIVGNTVYVVFRKKDHDIQYINGRGIVEDPTKLKYYKLEDNVCVEHCFDEFKDEYPLSMKLYRFVTSSIMQFELGMTLQTVEDMLNNAQNEVQSAK